MTETISNYNVNVRGTCASANAHMDSPGMGIVEDVEWFHAIDKNSDGVVSYYFGVSKPCDTTKTFSYLLIPFQFKSCKAKRSDGQPLPVHFSSQVCNEQNIGTFILTSVKRRACILENYNKDNAIELCENLEAATGH